MGWGQQTPSQAFYNDPAARNASRSRADSLNDNIQRKKVNDLHRNILRNHPNWVEKAQNEINTETLPIPQPLPGASNRALTAAQTYLPRNQNNVLAAQRKAAREQSNIWNMNQGRSLFQLGPERVVKPPVLSPPVLSPPVLLPPVQPFSVVQSASRRNRRRHNTTPGLERAQLRKAEKLRAELQRREAARKALVANNGLGNNPLGSIEVESITNSLRNKRLAEQALKSITRAKKNSDAFVSPVGLYGNDTFVENLGSSQNKMSAPIPQFSGSVRNTRGSNGLTNLERANRNNSAAAAAAARADAFGSSVFPSAANVDAANAGVNAAAASAAEAARAAASAAKLRAEQEERALARARLRAPEIPAIVQNPFGGPNPFGSAPNPFGSAPKTNNAAAEAAAAAAAAVHAANVAALQYNAGSTLGCTPCEAEILSKLDTLLDRSKPSTALSNALASGRKTVQSALEAVLLGLGEAAATGKAGLGVAGAAVLAGAIRVGQAAALGANKVGGAAAYAVAAAGSELEAAARTARRCIKGSPTGTNRSVRCAALFAAVRQAAEKLKSLTDPRPPMPWPPGLTFPKFNYFTLRNANGKSQFNRNVNRARGVLGRFGTRVATGLGAAAAVARAVTSRAAKAVRNTAGMGAGAVSRAMYRLSGREQANMIKQLVQKVTSLELQGRITSKALEELNAAIAVAKPGVVTADLMAEAAKLGANVKPKQKMDGGRSRKNRKSSRKNRK